MANKYSRNEYWILGTISIVYSSYNLFKLLDFNSDNNALIRLEGFYTTSFVLFFLRNILLGVLLIYYTHFYDNLPKSVYPQQSFLRIHVVAVRAV